MSAIRAPLVAPSPTVDNEFALFNGTTGTLVKRGTPKVLIGGTTATGQPPNSIVVPSFENHPDRAFTPASSVDDHFDGSALDTVKWTKYADVGYGPNYQVGGSNLTLSLTNSSGTAARQVIGIYNKVALPNTSFLLTYKIDAFLHTRDPNTASGADHYLYLYNDTNGIGACIQWQIYWASGTGRAGGVDFRYGAGGVATRAAWNYTDGQIPKYQRIEWKKATGDVILLCSNDGVSFFPLIGVAGPATGLTSTIVPQVIYFEVGASGLGTVVAHVDWIKYFLMP